MAASYFSSTRLQVLLGQLDEGTKDAVARRRAAEEARYAPGAPYTNWSHLGRCNPDRHERPQSIADVVRIVRRAAQLKHRVRVVGVGHSYNGCQFTSGVMLHMTPGMARVLAVDPSASPPTISCEGGCTLADAIEALRINSLQLRCMPSITNLTVAGAIANATHGSGINTPSLCASLRSITFVDGRGEVVTYDAAREPELVKLASCHLGLLGVVVRLTLQVEPLVTMRAHHDVIPVRKIPSVLAQRVTMNEYYRFWWIPHTDKCYECVANRVRDAADGDGPAGESTAGQSIQSAKTTASATNPRAKLQAIARAIQRGGGGDAHDLDYQEFAAQQRRPLARFSRHVLRGDWLRHGVLEAALCAATAAPSLQPSINRCYQRIFLNRAEYAQGHSDQLFTFDCLFPQHGIEWAIEAHRALEALELVQQIVGANGLRVHFPVEFRFADADGCGLSPAFDRKVCWVGLVMFRPHMRDAPATERYYALFAQGMERLGGRPHWAKASPWTRKNYEVAYGAQFGAFLDLRARMDPGDIFLNDWATTIVKK